MQAPGPGLLLSRHFRQAYIPVPYKIRILDALDYVSDDYNRQMFVGCIFHGSKAIEHVDVCAC
jgi:hypothetical protein